MHENSKALRWKANSKHCLSSPADPRNIKVYKLPYAFTKQLKHMTEKAQILQTYLVLMKHSMISEGREKEAAQELHTTWPYSNLKFLTNTSDYLTIIK